MLDAATIGEAEMVIVVKSTGRVHVFKDRYGRDGACSIPELVARLWRTAKRIGEEVPRPALAAAIGDRLRPTLKKEKARAH